MKKYSQLIIFFLISFHSLFSQNTEDELKFKREQMVKQLFKDDEELYITIKNAFLYVKREKYIDENYISVAYNNMPIPEKGGLIQPSPQMISVILKEALISPADKVLMIGKNSIYIDYLISRLTEQLFVIDPGINFLPDMNFQLKNGLSYYGWLEEGPFDIIILFGSVNEIPNSLISQLKSGGKLIVPLNFNSGNQILVSIRRSENSFNLKTIGSSYIHSLR